MLSQIHPYKLIFSSIVSSNPINTESQVNMAVDFGSVSGSEQGSLGKSQT